MSAKETKELTLFRCVYVALLAMLAIYLGSLSLSRDLELLDFSEAWLANGDTLVDVRELNAGDFGGSVVLEKSLPDTLSYNDRLCLTISNARFTVSIDGKEVYAYDSPENLTGKGYGIAYHTINLSPEQAGKLLRMEIESVYDNHQSGRIYMPQIGSGGAFLYYLAGQHLLTILFSAGSLFLGILLVLLQPLFPKKQNLHSTLLSLGTVAIIAGLWMTNDTGILRLLTGNVLVDRVLDHALMHLIDFPLALLVWSLTQEKKMRYVRLVFAFTLLDIAEILFLRYFHGEDMAWLTQAMALYHAACFIVIVIMLISDRKYRKEHDVQSNLKIFYIAVACLAGSALLDNLIYAMGVNRMGGRGLFTRIGFAAFIALILFQTVRWWMQDRTTVDRDRFINHVLQYAVSGNNPEANIRTILQYVGTELNAAWAYIVEPQDEGSWYGTYEWSANRVEPRNHELPSIPYGSLMNVLSEELQRQNCLTISLREQDRDLYPDLYQAMSTDGVSRVVFSALETSGRSIGLLGVDDVPDEHMSEIAEVVPIISYILAQLIENREAQKKLVRYSYYDALTGCRNRRALEEYEKSGLDTEKPYGIVMCDINGLKQANDVLGHEAGDAMILDVSACIIEVFGAGNAYRTGGDEFVAYSVQSNHAAFDRNIDRLRTLITERGRSAAIGAVFRENGGADYEKAKTEADAMMYEDKRKYYEANPGKSR